MDQHDIDYRQPLQIPRVTIGLPFYNNGRTLADAIRSIFSQSYQDWELILVDDGSSDESLEIARAVDDPRVRVLSDGKNQGLAYRLNQIAKLARGEFVARMDADDLMHPERIEREVRFLDEHPDVDIVGTGTYTIDAVNRPVGVRGCGALELSSRDVLRRSIYEHFTIMARIDWCLRNPYDETFARAQDRELWCRTFRAGQTNYGKISDPLMFYRESGSVRLKKVLGSYRLVWRIISEYGPAMVGRSECRRLKAQLCLKSAIWCVGSPLGLQAAIIARRNRRLRTNECAAARAILSRISRTTVPGMDATNKTLLNSALLETT